MRRDEVPSWELDGVIVRMSGTNDTDPEWNWWHDQTSHGSVINNSTLGSGLNHRLSTLELQNTTISTCHRPLSDIPYVDTSPCIGFALGLPPRSRYLGRQNKRLASTDRQPYGRALERW